MGSSECAQPVLWTCALWIQEIKRLFNSMQILIIVFEFAMYSLELEIRFKKKMKFISDLPTLFFFTMLAETQNFLVWSHGLYIAHQDFLKCLSTLR
jgi:hypothetical protein